MEEIKFKPKEVKQLMKEKRALDCNGYVFSEGEVLYKFYGMHLAECFRKFVSFDMHPLDVEQIRILSHANAYVQKTQLPRGIIKIGDVPSGVFYDYFEGYHSFNQLYKEDKARIFRNLRSAIEKNIELMQYGIYNTDLIGQNILFLGDDVQLIDLDGPYIKFDEYYMKDVYYYFLRCILSVFESKLLTQYSKEDTEKIMEEIRPFFFKRFVYDLDYPYTVVDKVESLRLIR